MNQKEQMKQEEIENLKRWLKPNDLVHTVLRSVSRSGMFRRIDFYKLVIHKGKPEPVCLTYSVAKVLGLRYSSNDRGAGVSGCGMDMGFHCVYSLGRCLFPDGDGKTVTGRRRSFNPPYEDTEPETDGGYLLKQRWM